MADFHRKRQTVQFVHKKCKIFAFDMNSSPHAGLVKNMIDV